MKEVIKDMNINEILLKVKQVANKQDKTDNLLETTSKIIPLAINEVRSQVEDIIQLNLSSFYDDSWDKAIKKAIDKCKTINSNSKVTILFPTNVSNIVFNSQIDLCSNLILDLNNSSIKKGNVADFTLFNGDGIENVEIINGNIDGNGFNILSGVNGRNIMFNNSNNIKVNHIKSINNKSYGMFFNDCDTVEVTNCKFINDKGSKFNNNLQFFASINVTPSAKGSKNVNIVNNYFENVEGDNIAIGGINQDNNIFIAENFIIKNNTIINPCQNSKWNTTGVMCAINLETGSSHNKVGTKNVNITDNVIKGESEAESLYGINIGSSEGVICSKNIIENTFDGIWCGEQYDADISNNIIKNSRNIGIHASKIMCSLIISNNEITNYTKYGICFEVYNEDLYRNFTVNINNNIVSSNLKINNVPYAGISILDRPSGTNQTITKPTGTFILNGNSVNNYIDSYNLYHLTYRDLDENEKPYITILVSKNNKGFKAFASGIATITTGTNTVNVTHGIVGKIKNINATGRHSEVKDVYILDDSYGSGSIIRFRCGDNVTDNRQINWYVEHELTY